MSDSLYANRINNNDQNNDMDKYHFSHIYNGIVFAEDSYFGMIEFKIMKNDRTSDVDLHTLHVSKTQSVKFTNINHKCAWFAIICNMDGINELVGPLQLDLDLIHNGTRVIKDENFPEINGMIIDAVSNDPDNLIASREIPDWMIRNLIGSIMIIDVDDDDDNVNKN